MLILIFLVLSSNVLMAEEITVYYYERPPFYYTNESGEPTGILVEKIKKLKNSKFTIILKVHPPKRQLIDISAEKSNVCGLGWFKTAEREKTGIFSSLIFTEDPLGLLINKDFGKRQNISIKDIFKNKNFEFLKKNSFNYGDKIELLENEIKPVTYIVSSSVSTILQMIGVRQKYYTFIERIEAEYIFATKPLLKESMLFIPTVEITQKNSRYLYCSKNIPQDFIKLIKTFSF